MKNRIIFTLFLSFLSGAVGAEAFKSPDILVDSKLDFDWSRVLIHKARRLLSNYNMFDPFSSTVPGTIVVSESLLPEYLPKESLELVNDLGHMIGLDVLRGKTKISIHGLSYDIQGFKTDLKSTEEKTDGVVISSHFSANELNLKADKVTLALELPVLGGKKAPLIQIDILNPVIKAKGDRITSFLAKIKIQDKKDTFKLNILASDFDYMSDQLLKDPSQVEIRLGKIVVPELTIKAGNKDITFSPAKIEALLKSKEAGIKGLLIAQFAVLLKKGVGESILKIVEKHEFKKEYWLDSNIIKSQIKISEFASTLARNNLEVKLPGDFCTKVRYTQLQNECLQNKVTPVSKSRIQESQHEESLDHMKSLIDTGDANIVASISEDYVNKLLVTTYDAGLWKDTLDEADVELGSQKVFIRLDDRGDSGTLFMDVKYKFSQFQGFVLGKKGINFPLVLKVALRIEKHDGIPVMIIRLKDVDLSDETLLRGRPDVDMISNIHEIPRLTKKVLKTIRAKLEKMKNKDVIDLRFPELKGLGLDTVQFMSDGNGRMNAVMRLEDLARDQET